MAEFYRRKSKGALYHSWCKNCMKALSKGVSDASQTYLVPAYASETMLIEALRKQEIAAYPGKSMSYAHVDVIAWGCVGIEVKRSVLKMPAGYTWSFSPQQKQTLQADIIALIADQDIYLFPANHPAFYRDGQRKDAVCYLPEKMRKYRASTRTTLTDNEMAKALNAWHLIEVYRVTFGTQLRQGQAFPSWLRL